MKTIKMIVCIMVLALSLSNTAQAKDPDPDGPLVLGGKSKNLPGIHVYDAENTYLGLLVDLALGTLTVYNYKFESFVEFDMADGTIPKTKLYYDTPDCAGTPYLLATQMYGTRSYCSTYYTGQRTQPEHILIYSTGGGGCGCGIYVPGGNIERVVPAIKVDPKSIGYDIPVPLPFQFKAKIKSVED